MAGITDAPMRRLAERFGAGLVVSEMIASNALATGQDEMVRKLDKSGNLPHVVQLAGCEAQWMKRGAEIACEAGADIIDINMGCPAKRVTNGYAGSALMRVPDEALRLIDAVVAATPLPVTVKMRLGWDDDSLNAADLARRAVDAGVQMITVHGRTRQQFYKGEARWNLVRAVVEAVDVPVVVNGDIVDLAAAQEALQPVRRCRRDDRPRRAGAALGGRADRRGAGRAGGRAAPTGAELVEIVAEHYEALLSTYGRIGVRVARKHLDWYLEAAGIVLEKPVRAALLNSEERRRGAGHDPLDLCRQLETGGMMEVAHGLSTAVLQALPQPVIVCGEDLSIIFVNYAAEAFFGASLSVLTRQKLDDIIAFGSPIVGLVKAVAERRAPMTEYRVRVGSSRFGDASDDRVVDVFATPISDVDGRIALLFQERTMADKIDRQLVSRGAARSVTGLASMLAHEIKNPLSGIRGAAQLLEQSVTPDELPLARLVRDEVDRIVDLIDRVEVFGDDRPVEREPINIHVVLDRVKLLAKSGVARGITFYEDYDPSLPPVGGNRDQLIQVFLNLVKNAAEALERTSKPEIRFSTAFRPGIRISVQGVSERISLPLEIIIEDNGPGVPPDLVPILFDPFVTHQGQRLGPGSGAGRQDHRRSRRCRRHGQPPGPDPVPHPSARRRARTPSPQI